MLKIAQHNSSYCLVQMPLFGNYWEVTTVKKWQVAWRWAFNSWKLHQSVKASQVHKGSTRLQSTRGSNTRKRRRKRRSRRKRLSSNTSASIKNKMPMKLYDLFHLFQLKQNKAWWNCVKARLCLWGHPLETCSLCTHALVKALIDVMVLEWKQVSTVLKERLCVFPPAIM